MTEETLNKEHEHPGVTKIKKMFDDGDFETIDKMVAFWEAMENLGAIGGIIRRFILWAGVMVAAYFAVSGAITEWIKGIARQ
jgi:hypothetical protein